MSTKRLMPRESGKFIAENAKNISIDESGVNKLSLEIVKNLKNKRLGITNFSQNIFHPLPEDSKAADWIFVIDALNFSFWNDPGRPKWTVAGQTGYLALCAGVKKALVVGLPMASASFLATLTSDELSKILVGDEDCGVIPMVEERVRNLNEIGKVLLCRYNGTFKECIRACNKSAESLLKLVVSEFPCFRDEGVYQNQRVSFYKRAQILVGDIWACFQGKGLGEFHDIDFITMFPDYRVPQVLVHFGVMKYSEEFLNKLKTDPNLEPGCEDEVEIRGCSIEAVERVVKETRKLIKTEQGIEEKDVNSILVDHFLWDYRRTHNNDVENIPFHKVRTIYY